MTDNQSLLVFLKIFKDELTLFLRMSKALSHVFLFIEFTGVALVNNYTRPFMS